MQGEKDRLFLLLLLEEEEELGSLTPGQRYYKCSLINPKTIDVIRSSLRGILMRTV